MHLTWVAALPREVSGSRVPLGAQPCSPGAVPAQGPRGPGTTCGAAVQPSALTLPPTWTCPQLLAWARVETWWLTRQGSQKEAGDQRALIGAREGRRAADGCQRREERHSSHRSPPKTERGAMSRKGCRREQEVFPAMLGMVWEEQKLTLNDQIHYFFCLQFSILLINSHRVISTVLFHHLLYLQSPI